MLLPFLCLLINNSCTRSYDDGGNLRLFIETFMACDTYVICFVLYLPKNGITVNNDGLLIARQHKHKNLIKPILELSFYVWAEDEILRNEGNDLSLVAELICGRLPMIHCVFICFISLVMPKLYLNSSLYNRVSQLWPS